MESADTTPFFYNIYVSEEDYSVFYISFIFVEESNKPDVFNEIVGAIAFDNYVNGKGLKQKFEEVHNMVDSLSQKGRD